MLLDFLIANDREILSLTQRKTRDLAGAGPSSEQLERGLPIFYKQLIAVLTIAQTEQSKPIANKEGMAQAARDSDEPAMAAASGRHSEVQLAKSAGLHGIELQRLGYTLSHVVHAYGAMCQSINELAMEHRVAITADEFRNLNQCLDVAIAGAVTEFESLRDTKVSKREIEHLGFLAHELRNALSTVTMAFQLIKEGTVTARGSTGQVLERGLLRLDQLIERSLTEVRLRVEPKLLIEPVFLLQVVDQIAWTANVEAKSRKQTIEIQIDAALKIEVDQQLVYSALSNLIQNALKYSREGGKIKVRGSSVGEKILIEVEDECGGLSTNTEKGLFIPFEQNSENRKGLGLGLNIARRAITLNRGTLECQNLPGKGCIFRITLPMPT
jgi:signal transduction histidine kinase